MILSITSIILIQHEGCYWTVKFVAFPGPPLTPIASRDSTGAQRHHGYLDGDKRINQSTKALVHAESRAFAPICASICCPMKNMSGRKTAL
jgi:hypothetical protein